MVHHSKITGKQELFRIYNLDLMIVIAGEGYRREGLRHISVANGNEMATFVDGYLASPPAQDILLTGYPAGKMFEDFKKRFFYMEAAGGVVRNGNGGYLFIRRLGKWDNLRLRSVLVV